MNFDKQTIADCVIPVEPKPDERCSDAGYALAHPETCATALIIKPSFVNVCNLGSLQFQVFEFRNGLEVPVTTGLAFTSSTPAVFTIGVNSGSGTALSVGEAVITVVKIADGRTARATISVLAEEDCCDDVQVATSIVLDISNSARLPFGGSYATRLDFAKAIAKHYSDPILQVGALPKDSINLWTLDTEVVELLTEFTDVAQIAAGIDGVQQGVAKTDLLLLFNRVAEELNLQQ